MTTGAPDPRAFQSWEDAFQYPIPVVRKLEQQLRNNADENREKLRSLVGTSYRSLLDTAETIIDMEVRMEQVEAKLATTERRCNPRALDRITSNTVKMETHIQSRDGERYTLASQLAVLQNAPTVMARLMKRRGSYLLIAKMLVISRLVHKALNQSKDKPPIIEHFWDKLLSLRRKLLRRIDRCLASMTSETALLVESMCAYALATSSAPSDVLQHFHKVRMDKIANGLKRGDSQLTEHGVSSLKLCIQTCLDTQTIFPRRLAEALLKLKAQPLIKDPDIRGVYELNLDVHDRWLGDETRDYTPWPRHDELKRPEAEKILHRWSKDAISAFLKGVKKALDGEGRLKEVAHLRQELIETWILSGSRMAGVESANVLDDIRDTMNEKLTDISRDRTRTLQSVATELRSQLNNLSSPGSSTLALWSTTAQSSDLSNGALDFKTTILNTYQGRDQPIIKLTTTFDKWMESVLEVKGIIKSMKEARWDDTFAEDVDDESDDDFGDSKQVLLSDDDPRLLEELTQEALSGTLEALGRSVSNMVSDLSGAEKYDSVHKAVFVLRFTKEICDRLPHLKVQDKSTAFASPFPVETLQVLYNMLATRTASLSTQAYNTSLAVSLKNRSSSHILWEGNPPLPNQPSPSAFRYLRDLTKRMAGLGSDLWTPACVNVLRQCVAREAGKALYEHAMAIRAVRSTSGETQNAKQEHDEDVTDDGDNDESRPVQSSTESHSHEFQERRLKQLLFDALYIQRFASTADDEQDPLSTLVQSINVEDLDEAAVARLRKNAAEYARKTYLLFALLA